MRCSQKAMIGALKLTCKHCEDTRSSQNWTTIRRIRKSAEHKTLKKEEVWKAVRLAKGLREEKVRYIIFAGFGPADWSHADHISFTSESKCIPDPRCVVEDRSLVCPAGCLGGRGRIVIRTSCKCKRRLNQYSMHSAQSSFYLRQEGMTGSWL